MTSIYEKLLVGRYLDFDPPSPDKDGVEVEGFQTLQPKLLHINPSESAARPKKMSGNDQPAAAPSTNSPSAGNASRAISFDEDEDYSKVTSGPKVLRKAYGMAQKVSTAVGDQLFRQRVSLVKEGSTSKDYRNFVWLPWIPGSVSQVRSGGVDVLSGPFSGCWMTTHIRGGVRFVGHVGTSDTSATDTQKAKDAWNKFAKKTPAFDFKGFNPARASEKFARSGKSSEGARLCYALITRSLDFYVLIVYPVNGFPRRKRIAAIHKVPEFMPPFGQVEHIKVQL